VVLHGAGQVNGYQNRFEYQNKEKESTFGLNRISLGARTYNPTTGRMDGVDPLVDARVWVTPYNMAQNNPINRIDPDGALDEPLYKKAWNYVSSFFSGSDATRNTQSVAATTSYTLMKSQEVRTEYVTRVSSLDKTDSQGRTQAKMEARAKTPAVMREVAEQMRPSSGESTRVGGTASKTNAGVNNMVGTLGKVGKVAGVTAIGVSVYNVATAENKPQAVATEGGALVGAIAGGELGAETGAAIGVWFGGAGAVPGAIIGGIIGSIGGGIIGANASTSTYNAVTTKKEDKK
jgi:RHS repeat-associated protein